MEVMEGGLVKVTKGKKNKRTNVNLRIKKKGSRSREAVCDVRAYKAQKSVKKERERK